MQLTLTLIIRQRKYFVCLVFAIEGDWQKIFCCENFPTYNNFLFYCTCVHAVNVLLFHLKVPEDILSIQQ